MAPGDKRRTPSKRAGTQGLTAKEAAQLAAKNAAAAAARRAAGKAPLTAKQAAEQAAKKAALAAKKLEKNRRKGQRVPIANSTVRALTKTPKGPGKLHTEYYRKVNKIDIKTKALYAGKMAKLDASKIRANSRILNELKPGVKETGKQRILSLREEQTRRIAAYTSKCGPKSYILKYPPNHEYTIGCGEIFLCAQFLKIEKSDGTIVYAKRMKTPSGRHKGRLAFCSVNKPHEYVATYSGEKVTILDNIERVNINDKNAVAAHVKVLDQEEGWRKSHASYFKKNEERYSKPTYTPPSDEYKIGGKLDLNVVIPKGGSILSQMKQSWVRRLKPEQIKSIKIIEREFIKAGLTNPNLIAAALVNCYKESSFRPNCLSRVVLKRRNSAYKSVPIYKTDGPAARGPNERGWYDSKGMLRERSVGLFQFNVPASVSMKKARTEAEREAVRQRRIQFEKDMRDPVKNCHKVIERIKSWRGKQLRAAAAAGMGVPELAVLFATHIEICAVRHRRPRGSFAMKMFNNTERPRPKALTKSFSTPRFKFGRGTIPAYKNNGRIRLKEGQRTWVLGSSTATLLDYTLKPNIGRVGIGAYNAGSFLSYFKANIWPQIRHFQLPKNLVLAGFALNGLSSKYSKASVDLSINRHKALIAFFKAEAKRRGVTINIKIATNQPFEKKKTAINEFNRRIRQDGLTDDSVDIAKKIAPNGTCLPGTLVGGRDNLHLNYSSRKKFARLLDKL